MCVCAVKQKSLSPRVQTALEVVIRKFATWNTLTTPSSRRCYAAQRSNIWEFWVIWSIILSIFLFILFVMSNFAKFTKYYSFHCLRISCFTYIQAQCCELKRKTRSTLYLKTKPAVLTLSNHMVSSIALSRMGRFTTMNWKVLPEYKHCM